MFRHKIICDFDYPSDIERNLNANHVDTCCVWLDLIFRDPSCITRDYMISASMARDVIQGMSNSHEPIKHFVLLLLCHGLGDSAASCNITMRLTYIGSKVTIAISAGIMLTESIKTVHYFNMNTFIISSNEPNVNQLAYRQYWEFITLLVCR